MRNEKEREFVRPYGSTARDGIDPRFSAVMAPQGGMNTNQVVDIVGANRLMDRPTPTGTVVPRPAGGYTIPRILQTNRPSPLGDAMRQAGNERLRSTWGSEWEGRGGQSRKGAERAAMRQDWRATELEKQRLANQGALAVAREQSGGRRAAAEAEAQAALDLQNAAQKHAIAVETLKAKNEEHKLQLQGLAVFSPEYDRVNEEYFRREKEKAFAAKDLEGYKAVLALEELELKQKQDRLLAEFNAGVQQGGETKLEIVTDEEGKITGTKRTQVRPAARQVPTMGEAPTAEGSLAANDLNRNAIMDADEPAIMAAYERVHSDNLADIQSGQAAMAMLEKRYGKEVVQQYIKNQTEAAK